LGEAGREEQDRAASDSQLGGKVEALHAKSFFA
jgi:hypothetical protein